MLKLVTVALLGFIAWRIIEMSEAVDRLQEDVTDLTTVVESAKALISGLAQQIRDNATDPAALNAIADQLEQAKSGLADAVTANTTVEGGEPPAPTDAGGTATGGDTGTTTTDAGATGGGDGAGTEPSALDPSVDAGAGDAATGDQGELPPA